MASSLLGLLIALANVAQAGEPAPPAAEQPLPRTAAGFVSALTDVRPRLREAAESWDGSGAVPDALASYALYEQRLALELADRPSLADRVLPQLPPAERGGVRDEVRAQQALSRLSSGWPVKRRYTTGPAEPAARLWRFYGEGRKRFRVTRSLLAAVNLVESDFNRLRNNSVAGAQGPMQFIPSTWRAYGLGGDIRDPHDAILGAANYLHANGAPGDDARALFRYNPSQRYVRAVRRYERRMRTPAAFRAFYARSLFVRAEGGGHRRLRGP